MLVMLRTILIILISGTYLFLMGRFINIYLADVYYKSSRQALEQGEIRKAGDHIIKAVRMNSNEPAYYRQRAKVLLATLVWSEDRSEVKQGVLENLERAAELNPKNLATLRNNVPLYYFLAVNDIENGSSGKKIDPKYLPAAKDHYSKLKNLYNNDLGILADVAKYEKKLDLEEEFIQSKRRAFKLRPDIVDWHESFKGY